MLTTQKAELHHFNLWVTKLATSIDELLISYSSREFELSLVVYLM